MRDPGLEAALRAAGGVGSLARTLGISQPAVSGWRKIPADRVLAVESRTGVPRAHLRPDLYPQEPGSRALELGAAGSAQAACDEVDLARARQYDLLALLLGREPSSATLAGLAWLTGDDTALGRAHAALGKAAAMTTPGAAERAYFRLFVGVGRGEILPYASYYLTGFAHERPLARVRDDLAALGIARADTVHEPEDHAAILLEIMAGLAGLRFAAPPQAQAEFFARHLQPWIDRCFADIETKADEPFYRAVGALGRVFIAIEQEAFAIA